MAQRSPLVRKDPRICAPNGENAGITCMLCWVDKAQPLNFAFARFLEQHFSGFFVLAQQNPEKFVLFRATPCNSVGGPWGGVQCSKTGLKKTHGFPCYSVQFRAIPCYSVLFRAIPCNSVLFRAIPWRRNFEGLLALDHNVKGKLSDTGVFEGNWPFRL